ncbi:MAG: hypothetical protein AAB618_00495 [Patescibacteria group bacterium]
MKKKDPTHNNQQLGNLLLRYKKLIKPPQQSVINEVVEVVGKVVGVGVISSQFTYNVSSKTVYIKTSSLLRTEIIKNKTIIIAALKERLGEKNHPVEFI